MTLANSTSAVTTTIKTESALATTAAETSEKTSFQVTLKLQITALAAAARTPRI
jgi:hypothetical protein